MPARLIFVLLLSAASVGAGTLVQFRTTVGNFDVELYDVDKPLTTKNFLRYVQDGLYTNMIFHRAVANFVIQGGGFTADRGTTNTFVYSIPTYAPVTNEFKVGPFHSNVYGTIAMAKTSDPNSATSQFFFNLANNAASLDSTNNSGGFTVFGRIISGTNILNLLNARPQNTTIKVVNLVGVLSETPVLYSTTGPVNASDLIYCDVSLLNVVVAQSNNVRQVSWNSVSNRINYVEFTTNYPPVWQALTNKTGNGSALTINDSATNSARRFYRVRVTY